MCDARLFIGERDHDEIRIFLMSAIDQRQLVRARVAPRVPKVHEHRLARQLSKASQTVAVVIQKIGRGLVEVDRVEPGR